MAAKEDVLDLYEAPYGPARSVMCFDKCPKQLIAEAREPIPGAPARYDTEYERKGVCDLMMICEPKQGSATWASPIGAPRLSLPTA